MIGERKEDQKKAGGTERYENIGTQLGYEKEEYDPNSKTPRNSLRGSRKLLGHGQARPSTAS